MTDHISILNPEHYSDEDMKGFAERIFSPTTPVAELERICILLAHLPTEDAQQLLRRFRESARAAEISWLDDAREAGAFNPLEPRNELEEQELLTLKVIEEIDDKIVRLSARRDKLDLQRRKILVRYSATKALVATGHLDPDEVLGFDDSLLCLQNDIAEIEWQLEVEETLARHLRDSITTPRYKNADPSLIRHIDLD